MECDTRTRIEEVPVFAVVERRKVVILSLHHQSHVPVLEVEIGGEPFQRLVFTSGIEICLILVAAVEIPSVGIVVIGFIVSAPEDIAEVVAVVAGKAQSSSHIYEAAAVHKVGIEDKIVVCHRLVYDEVGVFLYDIACIIQRVFQSVLREFLVGLVLLVIAVSTGVVQGVGPAQAVVEGVGVVELDVVLDIVVGLVVVVPGVAFVIFVFAEAVVGAVHEIGVVGYSVPGKSGSLAADEIGQTHGIVFIHPAEYCHSGEDLAESIADITVGASETEGSLGIESAFGETGGSCN